MQHVFDATVPKESNATCVFFITNGAGLAIKDPEVIKDLYTSKNKYFDKHPLIKQVSHVLTGDSILFAETTNDWRDSRKAISPAFYKGKLERLTEIAKTAVQTTVDRFWDEIKAANDGQGALVDIMEHSNSLTSRILLLCAFGEDISD